MMNLIQEVNKTEAELPTALLETFMVPAGSVRGVLLLTEEQFTSYVSPKGDEKFALSLTEGDLNTIASDKSFFKLTGNMFTPGDVSFESDKDRAILLNIPEELMEEFANSDFNSYDDARNFLVKAFSHDHYVATANHRQARLNHVQINRSNAAKYVEVQDLSYVDVIEEQVEEIQVVKPAVVEAKPVEAKPVVETKPVVLEPVKPVVAEPVRAAIPVKVVRPVEEEKTSSPSLSTFEVAINTKVIEDTMKKVLGAEKQKKWTFTVKRDSRGFIESIEALSN